MSLNAEGDAVAGDSAAFAVVRGEDDAFVAGPCVVRCEVGSVAGYFDGDVLGWGGVVGELVAVWVGKVGCEVEFVDAVLRPDLRGNAVRDGLWLWCEGDGEDDDGG